MSRLLKKMMGVGMALEPAVADVVVAGHPVLRTACARVERSELGSKELDSIVDVLVNTMREHRGCGMAAPQIGVTKQVSMHMHSVEEFHNKTQRCSSLR